MALPTFSKCCFCINLKTGTIILAVLQIIGGLIGSCYGAFYLGVMIPAQVQQLSDPNVRLGLGLVKGLCEANPNAEGCSELNKLNMDPDTVSSVLYSVYVIQVIIYLGSLIFGSILCHGARKEISSLIKPWMIWAVISICLAVLQFIILAAGFQFVVGNLGGTIVGALISIYFILCVNSYKVELEGANK